MLLSKYKEQLKECRNQKKLKHSHIAIISEKMKKVSCNEDRWQELYEEKKQCNDDLYELMQNETKLLEKIESLT